MKIIQWYIAKNVILATALVFLMVLALSFIICLLNELRDIGSGDYGFSQAVVHVMLILPFMLYQFFPMLVLLGGVLGLGLLASNHELMVMRASGVSVLRIGWAVIYAAIILIILATMMGEIIAPRAHFLADKQKANAQSEGQAVATASGLWIHERNNFLHIERVVRSRHLENVTWYEFDDQHRLLAAYYAKFVDFENNHWLLHDTVKTTVTSKGTHSQQFPLASWNFTLTPNLLRGGLVEPDAMSLLKLSDYSNYLVQNHLQANSFQLAFWKRVFQPLTTLVMILLAIPFVFATPRSVNVGIRILFAIIIGFMFYIFNALSGQFSLVFQVSPFWGALVPTVLFAGVGVLLMVRVKS